jgi:hypothetical protein
MHELDTEIEIDADAERIWAILTDFAAYPRWNPFIRSIRGLPEPGRVLEVRIQPPGAAGMTFRPTVLVADRPRELCWRGRLLVPGLLDGEHRFRLEPVAGGRVRVRHGERFRGLLVPLLRARLERDTRRGFVAMNEALKRRAEGGDRRGS